MIPRGRRHLPIAFSEAVGTRGEVTFPGVTSYLLQPGMFENNQVFRYLRGRGRFYSEVT